MVPDVVCIDATIGVRGLLYALHGKETLDFPRLAWHLWDAAGSKEQKGHVMTSQNVFRAGWTSTVIEVEYVRDDERKD
jgi:hypothetical protein